MYFPSLQTCQWTRSWKAVVRKNRERGLGRERTRAPQKCRLEKNPETSRWSIQPSNFPTSAATQKFSKQWPICWCTWSIPRCIQSLESRRPEVSCSTDRLAVEKHCSHMRSQVYVLPTFIQYNWSSVKMHLIFQHCACVWYVCSSRMTVIDLLGFPISIY